MNKSYKQSNLEESGFLIKVEKSRIRQRKDKIRLLTESLTLLQIQSSIFLDLPNSQSKIISNTKNFPPIDMNHGHHGLMS